ncbi:hypothetical protein ACFL4G_04165 [Thermodesulfobacteriota bacterium]
MNAMRRERIMNKWYPKCFFVALLLGACLGSARSEARQKVSVAVFEVRFDQKINLSNAQANYFTDLIRKAAVRVLAMEGYDVMDRESIDVLLTPEVKREIMKSDQASDIRVAGMIGANFLATGEIFPFVNEMRVNLKLFEVATATLIDQRPFPCKDLADVEDRLPGESELLFRYILRHKPISKADELDLGNVWSGDNDKGPVRLPGEGYHHTDEVGEIIFDAKTGLEWRVGPEEDTTYLGAKHWIKLLNEEDRGWRLPTAKELAGLYKKGLGERNMPAKYKTTGWHVWTDELKGSIQAGSFNFLKGKKTWRTRKIGHNCRVFAVRARY